MSATPKKKLCWNCEGRVSVQEEECPYCGVYLSTSPEDSNGNISSLITPPYRLVEPESSHVIPPSPFKDEKSSSENEDNNSDGKIEDEHLIAQNMKSAVLPLALLLSGSVFFLFGLVLYICSNRGVLTLQWNANYWFLYVGLAIPLLILGWKYSRNIAEDFPEEN